MVYRKNNAQGLELTKQTEQMLNSSEGKFHRFFSHHSVVMLIIDEHGKIVEANKAAEAFYGYSAEQLNSMHVSDINVNATTTVERDISQAFNEEHNVFQFQHRLANGEMRDVEVYSTPIEIAGKTLLYSIIFDISQRLELQKHWRLSEQVYNHSLEGILITDERRRIISVNPAFEQITGFDEAEVVGKTPKVLSSGKHDEDFYQAIYKQIAEKDYWRGEIWNRRKDGKLYPEYLAISVVKNDLGQITHYVGIFSDISKQKKSEEKLEQLAHYDPLTSLPNRFALKLYLQQAIKFAHRNDSKCALLFVDLDRFKVVNDSLGHSAGDELLVKVSDRLSHCLRNSDVISRIGGDEFVILISDYEETEQLEVIANHIIADIDQPFFIEGNIEVSVGVSIGIAQYPLDSQDHNELLKFADASMYRAKKNNDSSYVLYNQEISQEASSKLSINTEVKKAAANDEFELYLQPQVDLRTNELLGAEALIRWNHPQKGLLTPDKFILLAESTGSIKYITQWLAESVISLLQQWQKHGLDLHISINVSTTELSDSKLVEFILNKLSASSVRPELLHIEIVESALIESLEKASALLCKLKQQGCKVAIDDFGTGFSSLSYLSQLPVDILKIDKSFIQPDKFEQQSGIVKSIIDLARNFNLSVIAEGVEQMVQSKHLLGMGCHIGQGYAYDKPLKIKDFTAKYLN